MEFLGHRGAADHLAALDHLHAQAGHREIGRAGEAVMPRADDDDVSSCRFRVSGDVFRSFEDSPNLIGIALQRALIIVSEM